MQRDPRVSHLDADAGSLHDAEPADAKRRAHRGDAAPTGPNSPAAPRARRRSNAASPKSASPTRMSPHRMPFQLSGGMSQRVALAAALARDPELLIADEPSTALDVTTQAEIIRLLKRVQRERGMSLILITHDLRLAFSTCDRVYVLYAGSLLEVGDDRRRRARAVPSLHAGPSAV